MEIEVLSDLRSLLGPARDQGARPTCLAFAASDAHAALRHPWSALSCEFAFYHAQWRAGRLPSTGAVLPAMLMTLKKDGQPLEDDWPYLDALPADLNAYTPPQNVSVFRRNGEPRIDGVDEIIVHLENRRPILLLITISDAFYLPGAGGVVLAPTSEAPDPTRRHAVVAVGHGRAGSVRVILVRNSWGANWGLAGHAWLPEPFIVPRLMRVAMLTEEVDVSAPDIAA